MFTVIQQWLKKHFSDPDAVILLLAIIFVFLVIIFMGKMLAPIIAALVLAYILEAIVSVFRRCCLPRWFAVSIVYAFFVALLVYAVVGLLPLLAQQFGQVVAEAPKILASFHQYLQTLPAKYPSFISSHSVHDIVASTSVDNNKIASLGKVAFSASISSVPSIVAWMVYLFLVPLLVLFFLKDKRKLIAWSSGWMPVNRGLIDKVLSEMKCQLGNYIRGKVLEMIIVGVVTYIGFWFFGLKYAPLLAFFVGLSVIIPYVGMVVVTIPVIIIGLVQWGLTPHFAYMFIVYLVIQALDGNLLVPLLFSEAVNLHPVAIIAAVLIFGSIWGFWGLFFAIPLATLVKSLVNAWELHQG